MKDFKGKVAVVTGAASGIGRALAERFAAEGMHVVLADVEAGALAQAERELKAQGASTLAVRTDVSKAGEVAALAEKTLAIFGAVHVVCNNAGVGGEGGPVWEIPVASWEWTLRVNLWGVIHGIQTFVPIMLRQGAEAHVVNTASIAGHITIPFLSPYHATKFAVVTISESLYLELAMSGAPVKVSVLCPGFVRTNIMTSERNRPAELQTAPRPTSEAQRAVWAAIESGVAAGTPPSEVAALVLDAIRENRFYVFPHPGMLGAVRERAEGIVAQRNPTLGLP